MSDIRPATLDDLAGVQEVVRAAYTPFIARIGREPGPMLDDYAGHIARGDVHVVQRDGAIAAILVLVAQADALLLDNVAVAPSAQGLGFGRSLMAFAEAQARSGGFGSIRLYTNEAMTENIALYRRLGYAETHRIEEKGLKRVYMIKALEDAGPPVPKARDPAD